MCNTCGIPGYKSCLRCKQSLANCRLVDKIRDAAHIAELTDAARSSSMRAYRAKLSQPQVGAIQLPRKQRATRVQAAADATDDDALDDGIMYPSFAFTVGNLPPAGSATWFDAPTPVANYRPPTS